MKKHITTILILSFMLTGAIGFAFPPDVPNEPDPPAPIANYVYLALFLAIGFAVYIKNRKNTKA